MFELKEGKDSHSFAGICIGVSSEGRKHARPHEKHRTADCE